MYFCYVDESGCLGSIPDQDSAIQPILAITGLFISEHAVPEITTRFLDLKRQWFPGKTRGLKHYLTTLSVEIKGNELKKSMRRGSRRELRHAIGFLNKLFTLLNDYDVKLVSQVYVKGVGVEFNGQASYASAIQRISVHFHKFLDEKNQSGLIIADGTLPGRNRNVSHSVFTQMFKRDGDAFPRLLEAPVFGDSQCHAGIQFADLLTSALIFPIAAYTYCTGHIVNATHVHPGDERVKDAFATSLNELQFRYRDGRPRRPRGGIAVSDGIERRRSGSMMFK